MALALMGRNCPNCNSPHVSETERRQNGQVKIGIRCSMCRHIEWFFEGTNAEAIRFKRRRSFVTRAVDAAARSRPDSGA